MKPEPGNISISNRINMETNEKKGVILNIQHYSIHDGPGMDTEKHRLGTGFDNRRILDNARRIYHELKKPLVARMPVVPGYI